MLYRFIRTSAEVQRQALQWLQKLCLLNIQVPLAILFDMFNNGIDTLQRGDDGDDDTTDGVVDDAVTPTTPRRAKRKSVKKSAPPPSLIVEVRSGCLDPDDICTVLRTDATDAVTGKTHTSARFNF